MSFSSEACIVFAKAKHPHNFPCVRLNFASLAPVFSHHFLKITSTIRIGQDLAFFQVNSPISTSEAFFSPQLTSGPKLNSPRRFGQPPQCLIQQTFNHPRIPAPRLFGPCSNKKASARRGNSHYRQSQEVSWTDRSEKQQANDLTTTTSGPRFQTPSTHPRIGAISLNSSALLRAAGAALNFNILIWRKEPKM